MSRYTYARLLLILIASSYAKDPSSFNVTLSDDKVAICWYNLGLKHKYTISIHTSIPQREQQHPHCIPGRCRFTTTSQLSPSKRLCIFQGVKIAGTINFHHLARQRHTWLLTSWLHTTDLRYADLQGNSSSCHHRL